MWGDGGTPSDHRIKARSGWEGVSSVQPEPPAMA